jgi:primosomal protein N' (replication factor Y)
MPSQAAAVAAIAGGRPGLAFLLWGVTGAGKTEVYLQAGARELAAHRSVLLLAPEIGLIPQLLDRCRARFGSRVIEYHSGMTDLDRVLAWRRCLEAGQNGESLVAVGTRSAVFLPLERLGLIVLDEEHDGSYKQESPMPCYHARDVARLRARHCGAHLVLGSATPSLETWIRTRQHHGDTVLLRLPERIGRRPLPPVRVVDMRLELAEGHRRLISRALMDRLQSLPERGEQAVVLVPRRGYRSFLSCRSCGEAVLCPHCDVALTVHRNSDGHEWLRCHWCDHRQEMGRTCSHCGSSAFKPFGAGTQRVMEKVGMELTGLRLLRFDQDSTRGRDGHRRLLERFAAGEADVLVGTQMLAKGMDLPAVTLAAVLAADGLMHRPDLRSSEHCLQLMLQLAGRAGRGERPGEVLVQTYSPEHPVIRHLEDGRYEQFLEEELQLRRQGGLVPFCRACLLRMAGPSAARTATAATALAEHIREPAERAGWCLVGPSPAPVARVAGRSRWQLLLHGPRLGEDRPWADPTDLPLPPESALRQLLPADVSLAIDPDPLQL